MQMHKSGKGERKAWKRNKLVCKLLDENPSMSRDEALQRANEIIFNKPLPKTNLPTPSSKNDPPQPKPEARELEKVARAPRERLPRQERRQRALREAEARANQSMREEKPGRQFARIGEPGMNQDYVELEDCYIGAVSDKAVQVHHAGEVTWIPKSVIEEPAGLRRWAEHVTLRVKEWFARKEELI